MDSPNKNIIKKRTPKKIHDVKDMVYLLALRESQINLSFIMQNFGELKGKRRFNPYDEITIPPNSYGPKDKRNKNSFHTTVGLWIFNKFFIESELFDIFHYVNKSINDKTFKWMHQEITHAVLENDIELKILKHFLEKVQKFMPYVIVLSPHESMHLLESGKAFDKKKKELYNKYKKEIESGDVLAMHKLEVELLDYAKEYMKDDPAMDSFNSGARASFGNNFKSMELLKGVVQDPITQDYSLLLSSYMNGVDRKEYAKFSKTLSEGPFSRARKTADGGYNEKLFVQAFGHLTISEEDCGTTKTKEVILSNDNIDLWMYSYMLINGQLIELTSKNQSKYMGKKVKFRFSEMCASKNGVCHKCAGNLFNRVEIKNIGLATSQIASKIKLLNMKKFHNTTIDFSEMNPMKAFGLI